MHFTFLGSISCFLIFLFGGFFQSNYLPPRFPGGAKAINAYFVKYANYPSEELATEASGECQATIYINKAGKVKFVHATGSNKNFNQETKRVFTLMPDWRPARRGGVPIDTFITRTIYFSMGTQRAKNDSTISEVYAYYQKMTDTSNKEFYAKLAKRDIERIQRAPVYEQAVQALRDSQYVEAVHLFDKVQKMGEEGQDMFFNKGIAYYRLDEIDSACACWQRAARLGDKDALKAFQQKCR